LRTKSEISMDGMRGGGAWRGGGNNTEENAECMVVCVSTASREERKMPVGGKNASAKRKSQAAPDCEEEEAEIYLTPIEQSKPLDQ